MNGYIVTLLMGLLLGGMVLNTASYNEVSEADAGFQSSTRQFALGSDRSEVSYAMDISRDTYANASYDNATTTFST